MKENKYDDSVFFDQYSRMSRSVEGLKGAGEWHVLKTFDVVISSLTFHYLASSDQVSQDPDYLHQRPAPNRFSNHGPR